MLFSYVSNASALRSPRSSVRGSSYAYIACVALGEHCPPSSETNCSLLLPSLNDLGLHLVEYARQMDPGTERGLTNSQWMAQRFNVLFTGPTGIGKTRLGQVLAVAATPHECTGGSRNVLPHEQQSVTQRIILPFERLHQINSYGLGATHLLSLDDRTPPRGGQFGAVSRARRSGWLCARCLKDGGLMFFCTKFSPLTAFAHVCLYRTRFAAINLGRHACERCGSPG